MADPKRPERIFINPEMLHRMQMEPDALFRLRPTADGFEFEGIPLVVRPQTGFYEVDYGERVAQPRRHQGPKRLDGRRA